MMQTISLCWQMALASVRGQMQYRLSFVVAVLSGMFFQGLGIVMIWAILETFTTIDGWGLAEIALLYGIRLTGHGVYLLFFSSLYAIDDYVREGQFDRLLVRPVHPLLQLMFTNVRITVLGDLFGGLAILTVALRSVDVAWTPGHVALVLGAILGGAMLDGAFQIAPAALTFRFVESWPARVIFDDILSRYSNYPTDIFGAIATRVLTFLVPVAFVAWLPAAALLSKETYLPAWVSWCAFPVGALFMTAAIVLFMRASKGYQSSGN